MKNKKKLILLLVLLIVILNFGSSLGTTTFSLSPIRSVNITDSNLVLNMYMDTENGDTPRMIPDESGCNNHAVIHNFGSDSFFFRKSMSKYGTVYSISNSQAYTGGYAVVNPSETMNNWDSYTIDAWIDVYHTDYNRSETILYRGMEGSSAEPLYHLFINYWSGSKDIKVTEKKVDMTSGTATMVTHVGAAHNLGTPTNNSQWVHILITREAGSSPKIFINGAEKQVTQQSATAVTYAAEDVNKKFFIGNTSIRNDPLTHIGPIKIFNRALSNEEAVKRYNDDKNALDAPPASNDADIKTVTIDGSKTIVGANFSVNGNEYVYVTSSDTVPYITAAAMDSRATVNITQATSIPGKATIRVKAPNNITTKEYCVKFVKSSLTPDYAVNPVEFFDNTGNPITQFTPNQEVSASVSVTKTSDANIPITLILAYYAPDGTLIHSSQTKQHYLSRNNSVTLKTKITPDSALQGCYLKAYVWDDPDGLIRLGNSAALPASE